MDSLGFIDAQKTKTPSSRSLPSEGQLNAVKQKNTQLPHCEKEEPNSSLTKRNLNVSDGSSDINGIFKETLLKLKNRTNPKMTKDKEKSCWCVSDFANLKKIANHWFLMTRCDETSVYECTTEEKPILKKYYPASAAWKLEQEVNTHKHLLNFIKKIENNGNCSSKDLFLLQCANNIPLMIDFDKSFTPSEEGILFFDNPMKGSGLKFRSLGLIIQKPLEERLFACIDILKALAFLDEAKVAPTTLMQEQNFLMYDIEDKEKDKEKSGAYLVNLGESKVYSKGENTATEAKYNRANAFFSILYFVFKFLEKNNYPKFFGEDCYYEYYDDGINGADIDVFERIFEDKNGKINLETLLQKLVSKDENGNPDNDLVKELNNYPKELTNLILQTMRDLIIPKPQENKTISEILADKSNPPQWTKSIPEIVRSFEKNALEIINPGTPEQKFVEKAPNVIDHDALKKFEKLEKQHKFKEQRKLEELRKFHELELTLDPKIFAATPFGAMKIIDMPLNEGSLYGAIGYFIKKSTEEESPDDKTSTLNKIRNHLNATASKLLKSPDRNGIFTENGDNDILEGIKKTTQTKGIEDGKYDDWIKKARLAAVAFKKRVFVFVYDVDTELFSKNAVADVMGWDENGNPIENGMYYYPRTAGLPVWSHRREINPDFKINPEEDIVLQAQRSFDEESNDFSSYFVHFNALTFPKENEHEKHISVSEPKQSNISLESESATPPDDGEQIVPTASDAIVQTIKGNFHVKTIKPDGNCLFSGILSFLDKDESADQTEIRRKIINKAKEIKETTTLGQNRNPRLTDQSLDLVINNSKGFGGEDEAALASVTFDKRVFIFYDTDFEAYRNVDPNLIPQPQGWDENGRLIESMSPDFTPNPDKDIVLYCRADPDGDPTMRHFDILTNEAIKTTARPENQEKHQKSKVS